MLFVKEKIFKEALIKWGLPDWRRFFVRTRWKTGRRVGLCGGFSAEVRAKKMRQDGSAEFISTSLNPIAKLFNNYYW